MTIVSGNFKIKKIKKKIDLRGIFCILDINNRNMDITFCKKYLYLDGYDFVDESGARCEVVNRVSNGIRRAYCPHCLEAYRLSSKNKLTPMAFLRQLIDDARVKRSGG